MATKTWLGGHLGDPNSWNETLNWTGGLPAVGDDVIINLVANEPILDSDTVSLASLTINTGANLTLGTFTLSAVTVSNSGTISGTGDITGGQLGVRIANTPGSVTNEGTITGGYGGVGASAGGVITNSGTSSDISGGRLGVRIQNAPGTVINEGSITGAYAGILMTDGAVGTVTNSGQITGTVSYGSGVYLHAGGSVTNTTSGSITGGYFGVQITTGATGTVTNSGTITGGTGGVFLGNSVNNTLINSGIIIGVSGPAVQFYGSGSDLLEVLPGASFTGLVEGGTGTNTLELAAGTGAGTLTGLGTTVTNFNTLEFDSSAQWVLGGNITGLGGASAITGFSTTDTINLTGFAAVSETFANNALVLTDASRAQATLNIQGPFSSSDFRLSTDGSGGTDINLACYLAGTRLSTDHGEVAVEDLVIGERLVTVSGEAKPIKWIGHRSYSGRFAAGNRAVLPILIRAGALAEGVPSRDLMVSPKHAMFLDGMLIPAEHLINGVSVAQIEMMDEIAYFHIELDEHDVIHAEGALSETYVDDDNRGMFHNAHEFYALHSDAHSTPARYFAERVEDGYELEAVRRRVDVRAGLRQQDEPPTPTTLRGSVDHVGLDLINGWVQNIDHPEAPVCVDVFDNSVLIARTLANRYRPDLKKANLGSGRHSFEVSFPTSLSPQSRHVIQVCRSSDGTPLGTPRVVEPLRISA